MSYSDALCVGQADVPEPSETECERCDVKKDGKAHLLSYLYENSMYLSGVLESIRERWGAFGLATRLSCVEVLEILEDTMLVTITEVEEDSEEEYEFEETFGNTIVSEKNIFL